MEGSYVVVEGVEGGHLWVDNFRGGGGDGRHRKYDFYHAMVTERVSILHSGRK